MKHTKLRNMDIRLVHGTYEVCIGQAGSLVIVSKEVSKCKLDLVGVQEGRWEGGDTEPAEEYTFFHGKGNENHELGADYLCIRESYQQLRGLSMLVIGCHTYY
jgi:hypothetical protein